jgi:hypothetical protein
MTSTDIVLADPRRLKAREAATHTLASQTGTTEDIRADLALKASLDAYGIPSEFWHTGGGCTARYVSFAPDGEISDHELHVAITDDASVDHSIAEHTGWFAMWYGPEFDGYADNELYNSEFSLENPTLADMAHDSAGCARAIRDWYDGAATQWTRNEVDLEGVAGPYRCQTRSETPHGRTEVRPDKDGHYRTGAFHWPWTEYTDRDVAPVTELIQTIRWKYEHEADSWTVITADHGWRAKVIDVLATPSHSKAPHVADALFNALYETALSSYEVTANGPGDAAAAVRAHFADTRADRDPHATVQVFDLPGVQLPGPRP